MTPSAGRPDPLHEIEGCLARAETLEGSARESVLARALAVLDGLPAPAPAPAAAPDARADAYRAEVLRRLGRPREAGAVYARVVLGVIGNAEAVGRGLGDLLDRLCAYEALLEVLPAALSAHPGRRWQWEPMGEEARKRLRLEAEAPLSPIALAAFRRDVAKRLSKAPCAHDDDRRPVAAAVARDRGLDERAVLAWLSDLGACCCDCQAVAVKGPREPRQA